MAVAAAFVLARSGDFVLAVTRPEGGFALPGGHVEPGETPSQAAARELVEETGYAALGLRPLFTTYEPLSGRHLAAFSATHLHGKLRSSDEGVAVWVPQRLVLDGPYGSLAARALAMSMATRQM